jgi:hypothetical protein
MRVGWCPSTSSICWLDASSTLDVQARYINDPLLPLAYNVSFVKRPELALSEVVALRDISCGEELYVDYGRDYWRGSDCKGKRLGVRELGEAYARVWTVDGPTPPNDDIRRIVEMARVASEKEETTKTEKQEVLAESV